MALATPVLLIIFNRPDLTERVFNIIQEVKPRQLFVAADGPRNPGEKPVTDLTRSKIKVDWDCEVSYNYSEENLGCGIRPATAISWAFEEVEELIIVEDDCLPSVSFFNFCSTLLERYRHDQRIGTINGTTIPHSADLVKESYYFSRFSVIWGWATWKRVWKNYDFSISDWENLKNSSWLLNAFSGNSYYAKGFELMFDAVKTGWDVWDAQLFYMCLKHHYMNIHPSWNLVTNVGFDGRGTHTHHANSKHANMPANEITNLKHPSVFVFDNKADEIIFHSLYQYTLPYTNRIARLKRSIIHHSKKIIGR